MYTLSEKTIILAEQEVEVGNYLEMALRIEGYDVRVARQGDEVREMVRETNGSLAAVLLDVSARREKELDSLRHIRRTRPRLPVIVLSGLSAPEAVVEAMRAGASDFLAKPLTRDRLIEAVRRASETTPARADAPPGNARAGPVVSSNPRMRAIRSAMKQIALSDVPVVLRGESGVGKEVLAREIHALSPRSQKPLLKINCAAVPLELLESELFGYERGAFTGAMKTTPGKFEVADGGTILLDEIGDMDFKLQAKLLHVLQDSEFQRLGGRETIRVNVRVLAATHCDLEHAIEEGRFREDLFYRLNVINLVIPPLRERRDEVVPLARHFLAKHTTPDAPVPELTARLTEALVAYHWPGNIRELENAVRKFLVFRDADAMADELWQKVTLASAAPRNVSALDEVKKVRNQEEARTILDTLNQTHWNRRRAAEVLNIDYKGLLYRMKKLRIGGPHPAATAGRNGKPEPQARRA